MGHPVDFDICRLAAHSPSAVLDITDNDYSMTNVRSQSFGKDVDFKVK